MPKTSMVSIFYDNNNSGYSSMKRSKISHGITLVLAGAALSVGALTEASAASTTMYNMDVRNDNLLPNGISNRVGGTDGWVWGSVDNGASFNWNYGTATPGFAGTGAGNPTPFGYIGKAHLNWAVQLGGAGDTAQISTADALSHYGPTGTAQMTDVELDTGAGSWQDAQEISTGWKHLTDIGLIKSDVTQKVTLNLTRMSAPSTPFLTNDNFGVTVFTGMDTNITGTYSHHGGWNCPTCSTALPFNANNPFGTTGLTYLTHDATVDAINGLTFTAQAGQIYSIYLGGAGVGVWNRNVSDYKLDIATSPVPVPGAAWLFGSALAGMIGVHRRRRDLSV